MSVQQENHSTCTAVSASPELQHGIQMRPSSVVTTTVESAAINQDQNAIAAEMVASSSPLMNQDDDDVAAEVDAFSSMNLHGTDVAAEMDVSPATNQDGVDVSPETETVIPLLSSMNQHRDAITPGMVVPVMNQDDDDDVAPEMGVIPATIQGGDGIAPRMAGQSSPPMDQDDQDALPMVNNDDIDVAAEMDALGTTLPTKNQFVPTEMVVPVPMVQDEDGTSHTTTVAALSAATSSPELSEPEDDDPLFCMVCKRRRLSSMVSSTHGNTGGEEAYCKGKCVTKRARKKQRLDTQDITSGHSGSQAQSSIQRQPNTPMTPSTSDEAYFTSGIPAPPERRTFRNRCYDAYEAGYDSDGNPSPPDVCDEEEEHEHPSMQSQADSSAADDEGVAQAGPPIIIDDATLSGMSVADLRVECQKRRLPTKASGKNILKTTLKDQLIERMHTAPVFVEPDQAGVDAGGFFSPDSTWKLLDLKSEATPNPLASEFRNPTTPEGDPEPVRFDVDYSGTVPECTAPRNGKPKDNWIHTNMLTVESSPIEWMEALIPRKTYSEWTRITNTKARLMGMGTPEKYPSFTDFSTDEVIKFIGLYVLQGLIPSAQLQYKFHSQSQDPVAGNNVCHRVFGGHSAGFLRLKHFKYAFGLQDPLVATPSTKTHPTFKVDPFLKMMIESSTSSFTLGSHPAGDEQTMRFQGRSAFKLRITYKAEGDGFQCDAICQDGFTYCFYFRQAPPPEKFIKKGFSPLHARVLEMLEKLPGEWYRITFDNLYISTKFVKEAYKMKILVAGVARQGGRGIPPVLIQKHETTVENVRKARGTVKAAVLEGDDEVDNFVAVSCYDQKPVYFITTMAECIKWVIKQKKVYSIRLQELVTISFLRLNILDEYNFNMGSVDIADQLRNYYRIDKCVRNWKWWWSVFMWGLGMMMVNAYVLYTKFMESQGITQPLSHYEFRQSIALAMLDPATFDPDAVRRHRRQRRVTRRVMEGATSGTAVAEALEAEAADSPPDEVADVTSEFDESVHKCMRLSYHVMGPSGRLSNKSRSATEHSLLPINGDKGGRCQWCLNSWLCDVKHSPNAKVLARRINKARENHDLVACRAKLWCSRCKAKLCVNCWNFFHKAVVGRNN